MSFRQFKWGKFLPTELMPYLFCFMSLPLAPLSKHMPMHHGLCLGELGTKQVQSMYASRNCTRGYLICFSIPILSGISEIPFL